MQRFFKALGNSSTRRGFGGWMAATISGLASALRPSSAGATSTSVPTGKLEAVGSRVGSASTRGQLPQLDLPMLRAVADTALPRELSDSEREATVAGFLRWLRDYRESAEMDHGYGFTRLRETGAHPALRYADDLDALRQEARSRFDTDFADLLWPQRFVIVTEAIERAAPDMESLPSRPDGTHVITGLMSHYYRSAEAVDRCYGARIGRESCRGLFIDVDGPPPIDISSNGGRR